MLLDWCKDWCVNCSSAPGTMPLPLRPLRPVRLAADVDHQTADALDAVALEHQTTRAEVIRAAVRLALDMNQEAG